MNCASTLCVGLALAGLSFPSVAFAQANRDRTARIRVNVNLVLVPTSVIGADGRPVTDLPKSAFHLSENGVAQKIARFETLTNRPLDLALMVDSSMSTFKDLKFEREATARFIHLIVRPVDRLAVFAFADSVDQLSDFSSNVAELEAAAMRIMPGAGTSLYDAIVLGSHSLESGQPDRRRVLVLVTDAGETTSFSSFDEARRAAIHSGALLYTILIRPVKNENGRNTAGEHALDTIIDSTGGAMYYPDDFSQLDDMYEQIDRELRTQYVLGYYPSPEPPAGSYRQIELRIAGGRYTLHYRKGYFSEEAGE